MTELKERLPVNLDGKPPSHATAAAIEAGERTAARIFEAVRKLAARGEHLPSQREIAKEAGILSASTVHTHLRKLTASGMLRMTTIKGFSVYLPIDAPCPLCGNAPDGAEV